MLVFILYRVSGHCGTDVSRGLILSESKSMCHAVSDAGLVCIFGAECECLVQVWELCGKSVVGLICSLG